MRAVVDDNNFYSTHTSGSIYRGMSDNRNKDKGFYQYSNLYMSTNTNTNTQNTATNNEKAAKYPNIITPTNGLGLGHGYLYKDKVVKNIRSPSNKN